jgi:DNA-binding response OmpR family regulator
MVKAISEIPGTKVEVEDPDTLVVESAMSVFRPDVVLVDIELAGGKGIEIITQFRRMQQELTPVIMALTSTPTLRVRASCLEAGASFLFDKTCEQDRILESLESIKRELGGEGEARKWEA